MCCSTMDVVAPPDSQIPKELINKRKKLVGLPFWSMMFCSTMDVVGPSDGQIPKELINKRKKLVGLPFWSMMFCSTMAGRPLGRSNT
jgi:hypothetical protein